MALPVFEVRLGELFRADDQQVLRVLLLGRLGEVERAGDYDRPVDDDDLVVGDGMPGVDVGRDAGVRQKGGRRVLLGLLALVEDCLDLHAAPVGLEQGLGDRGGGEGVGLDEDLGASPVDLPDDRVRCAVVGAEIDLDRGVADVHVEGQSGVAAEKKDEEEDDAGRDETAHTGSEARGRRKNPQAETRFQDAVELEPHR